jgi:hypothetical protein
MIDDVFRPLRDEWLTRVRDAVDFESLGALLLALEITIRPEAYRPDQRPVLPDEIVDGVALCNSVELVSSALTEEGRLSWGLERFTERAMQLRRFTLCVRVRVGVDCADALQCGVLRRIDCLVASQNVVRSLCLRLHASTKTPICQFTLYVSHSHAHTLTRLFELKF